VICSSTLCVPSSDTRPHLHCPMLTPSSLSCTLPSCHALRTRSRSGLHKPKCTLAHSPVRCSVVPYNCLSSPSTTPIPQMWDARTHAHHVSRMRFFLYSNMRVPRRHKVLPCQQSLPRIHTVPCHSCWGKNVPGPWLAVTMLCPPPPTHTHIQTTLPPHSNSCCIEGQCVRVCVWGRHRAQGR
jgi:hypothetical protein